MIPHITLYIVTDPNGKPIKGTASCSAHLARMDAENTYNNHWKVLHQKGYRVMKLRCHDAKAPNLHLEGNDGANHLSILSLGHNKIHISACRNNVVVHDATGSEETVLNDFLNQMK